MSYEFEIKNKKAGFSLLEILVVLAIASLILSFVFFQVQQTRSRGKDARREQDMKQLQNALSLYIASNAVYPCVGSGEVIIDGASDCLSSALISSKSMPATPIDPMGGSTGVCGGASSYVYCYQALNNGASYQIRYNLETDTIQGKSSGWQTVSP